MRLVPGQAGPLRTLGIRVRNSGQAQRRVEVRCVLPLRLGKSVRYWDGGTKETVAAAGRQRERRAELDANLYVPLIAVGGEAGAVVTGLSPDSLCSYYQPALDYTPGGLSRVTQTLRLVLEGGQEDGVTLCGGAAPGAAYGLTAAAWETYQQAFPRFFRPTPGVCDNIWGASAEYMTWAATPQVEPFHRLHVTWDWCYTPFRRVGDLAARDEEWNYKPLATPFDAQANSMLGVSPYPMAKKTAAEFRADRQRYFEQYGLDHGLMFYNLVHWVEKQLAQEKFADSLVVDKERKTELSSWCRFHDVELAVMPTGGSYEQRIVPDMERVAQELPLTGFALDVFVNRERNHSEYVGRTALPGRAWDEAGVYQDIGVSMSRLADRLHELKLRDRPFDRVALVGGNGTVGFHTDATLYECTAYGRDKRNYPLWRMSMGQKPGVIWSGWDIPNILPQWERLSRREFLKAFWGITDYTRLKCFQWGIFPTYSNLVGVDAFQRDMPLLISLVKQGWHPLAPVKVTVPARAYAWPARYGSGASHTLVIGSPNEQPVPGATVEVDNTLLGSGNSVYVSGGEWLGEQQVRGRRTRLAHELPARDLLVLRSALTVDRDCSAKAREERAADHLAVTVELTPAKPGPARFEAATVPGYRLEGLEVNGRKVTGKADLRAGSNTVRLSYRSEVFHNLSGSLSDFPFLSPDNRLDFVCVAASPQRRDYARVIPLLSGYFDYTCRQALRVADPGAMTVVTDPAAAAGRTRIVLELGDRSEGWTVDSAKRCLTLRAASEAEAVRATQALLDELDRRYPYTVPFRGGMAGMYQPVQEKHRMIGKTLEQMLAEEGLR